MPRSLARRAPRSLPVIHAQAAPDSRDYHLPPPDAAHWVLWDELHVDVEHSHAQRCLVRPRLYSRPVWGWLANWRNFSLQLLGTRAPAHDSGDGIVHVARYSRRDSLCEEEGARAVSREGWLDRLPSGHFIRA